MAEAPPDPRTLQVEAERWTGNAARALALPSVVETRHEEVVVRGTRFEVRFESAGAVEFEVGEGEMGHVPSATPLSKAPVKDAYGHLEWTGDYLAFQATPLRWAIHEVERRYGVEVELEDRRLESLAVTATFTGALRSQSGMARIDAVIDRTQNNGGPQCGCLADRVEGLAHVHGVARGRA